jgi:hypothetical protein
VVVENFYNNNNNNCEFSRVRVSKVSRTLEIIEKVNFNKYFHHNISSRLVSLPF